MAACSKKSHQRHMERKKTHLFVFFQAIKAKLRSVCDGIGLLKSQCRKFVDANLAILIEELTTTDDVRTICVNAGVCK